MTPNPHSDRCNLAVKVGYSGDNEIGAATRQRPAPRHQEQESMMRRNLTVRLSADVKSAPVPVGVRRLDVVCNSDGTLTVIADPRTLARLGGRSIFGAAKPVRRLLLERIAEAWYAADCPQEAR
jgi:hypothetical protein